MMSTLIINANAANNTLRVNFYVSDSFLSKNGVPTATTTYLNNYFNKVRNAYYGIAGIHLVKETFNYSNTSVISTPADECPYTTGSGYNNLCSCVSTSDCSNNNSNHHTNAVYIKDQYLPSGSLNTHANVLLVSHKICWVKPSGEHGYLVGMAWKNTHRAILRDTIMSDSDGDYSLFREVMAHELGHLYTVTDHYGDNDPHPNCIWGNNRHQRVIATRMTMCSTCRETLISNKSKYNQ
ncbi:MAG: hypothetical protein IJ740_16020 [Ruminococcus sp.]|nr:hypothetical protein [Ruminococcus sp.]